MYWWELNRVKIVQINRIKSVPSKMQSSQKCIKTEKRNWQFFFVFSSFLIQVLFLSCFLFIFIFFKHNYYQLIWLSAVCFWEFVVVLIHFFFYFNKHYIWHTLIIFIVLERTFVSLNFFLNKIKLELVFTNKYKTKLILKRVLMFPLIIIL